MRSKLLFSVATALCVSVLLTSPVQATWVPVGVGKVDGPWWAIDLGRSITGIIQGVLTLCGDGDAKAELIAVQEGTNSNADGTSDDSTNTTTASSTTATGTAGATALTNGVYSYIQSEVLSQTDLTKYSKLQEALSSPNGEGSAKETCESLGFTTDRAKQTCIAVVETFFADRGDEGNTEEYKAKILSQRRAYARQVAERHVTLGYNVQQKVIADLQAAAQAPVSSDNEIGAIAIDGQTLDEMLKVTVADLAIQIEMMEADAVNFLVARRVEIMSKDRPEDEEPAESPAAASTVLGTATPVAAFSVGE